MAVPTRDGIQTVPAASGPPPAAAPGAARLALEWAPVVVRRLMIAGGSVVLFGVESPGTWEPLGTWAVVGLLGYTGVTGLGHLLDVLR